MAYRNFQKVIDQIFVTTWLGSLGHIRDNIFDKKKKSLWSMFRTRGGIVSQVGGDSIKFPIEKSVNDALNWLYRGEAVDLQDFDPLEQVEYDWHYANKPVVRFYQDDLKNAGKAQIFKLVKVKVANSINAFEEGLDAVLFGNNASNARLPFGLQDIVADTPSTQTDLIGGINPSLSANSWWRNQTIDFSDASWGGAAGSDSGATVTDQDWADLGVSAMRQMLRACRDKTDVIITSEHMYDLMQDDLMSYYVYDGTGKPDLGLPASTPTFDDIPVLWSANCGNRMYFLDMDSLQFFYDPRAFMTFDGWLPLPNQPGDRVGHINLAGALVCSERRANGVIHSLPT